MDQLNHSNGLKAASKRHEHEFHGVRFGAEIQGSWLYDQQPTTLVVGSNYFSISNHGMMSCATLTKMSVEQTNCTLVLVTESYACPEANVTFSLQFSTQSEALRARGALRLALNGGALSSIEVSEEEMMSIMMMPGFDNLVNQYRRLLSIIETPVTHIPQVARPVGRPRKGKKKAASAVAGKRRQRGRQRSS